MLMSGLVKMIDFCSILFSARKPTWQMKRCKTLISGDHFNHPSIQFFDIYTSKCVNINHFICHKVGKLTGCDFCGFTFYFDNHLRFFDYSRVNLLIIFHFHFLFFTFTFYFWQPPAFLWLFTGEFAYYFFTFTFYFDNHLRFFNYSRVNKFIAFCGMSILQPICNHTDEISQLSWHENLTI